MRSSSVQEILNGRYRLIRPLGEGGMGSVYLAHDVFEEGKEYALKILKPELEEEVEAFRREFGLLSELRHPHIARVYDFGTVLDSGLSYYTTEYIDGKDFYSAAREQNWEILVHLVVQVCSALDYLHGRGILHRDLKPANILVGRNTMGRLQAKLCDFGLALRGDVKDAGFCGSIDYAAPELLKGEPADQRTDLYALGIILYQAVSGELPFPSANLVDSIRARLETRPSRPSRKNEDVSEPLEEIILSMLEPRPEERPTGAREVVERLAHGLNRHLTVDFPECLRATVYSGKYIERSGELAGLKSVAHRFLLKGGHTLVLIRGPFGSGKTRLLEEWRNLCELEGSLFYATKAREGESLFILLSWLRQLLGEPNQARKDAEKNQLLEKYATSLSPLLPSYYKSGKKVTSSRLSEQGRRLKIFEDLYQVFFELLAQHPAILAADDLHLADQLTLEALRYILQAKQVPRAVWALAFGDSDDSTEGETNQGKPVPLFYEQLRLIASQEIVLGGFEQDHVELYLHHVFAGQQIPSSFGDYLAHNTGGIPLFIEETLLELLVRGQIKYTLGAWTFPTEITCLGVAQGFGEYLKRRLTLVTGEAREFLKLMSLADGELPTSVITSLMGESNPNRVRSLIDDLEQQGLVLEDDSEGPMRMRLAHRTLAETLRAEVPEQERRRLNLRIAEILKLDDGIDRWASEIARQLYAGGEVGQVPQWAVQAADSARASFQNERALKLYHLALSALTQGDSPPTSQGAIRLSISEMENLAGRIPESIDVLKSYLDQYGADVDADQRLALMEKLATAYERRGELSQALGCWTDVIQLKSGGERARMMANVGWIQFRLGDVKSSLMICQESLRQLDKIGDTRGQANIHNTLGRIYFYSGDLGAAQEHWNRCLKLRQVNRDKKDLADSHNNLGIVLSSRGNVREARKHFEMALQFSEEVGDLLRMNGLLVNLGIMAFEAGDLDLAQRRYSEALEFFRRSGGDRELLDCLNNLGEICLLRTEFAEAIDYWEECLKICAASGFVQGTVEPLTYLGTLRIVSNCLDVGREYLDRAWKAAEGTQALKEQALILEQRGLIALRQRQFEQARSHFQRALGTFQEMKLTFLASRLKLRLAELAWYEGRKSEYSTTLENIEAGSQSQESRWLQAELNRLKGFDLRSDDTEEALDLAIQLGQCFPDLLWRAYWLQGRFYHHRRRYGLAGQSYQKAVDTIKRMFSRMPENLIGCYSKHPELLLLKDNATKLKTEIVSARRQTNA